MCTSGVTASLKCADLVSGHQCYEGSLPVALHSDGLPNPTRSSSHLYIQSVARYDSQAISVCGIRNNINFMIL